MVNVSVREQILLVALYLVQVDVLCYKYNLSKFSLIKSFLFQNRCFGYFTVAFISVIQNYRTKININTNQIESRDMDS